MLDPGLLKGGGGGGAFMGNVYISVSDPDSI